jgi:hypothetical protein
MILISLLRTLTDQLYSLNTVVKKVKEKYPDEEIIFASAATILETKKLTPVGWSFQRFLQRRGVIVITRNRLLLEDSSSPWLPFSIFWSLFFRCLCFLGRKNFYI